MKTDLSTKKEHDWILWTILLIGFLFRFLFLALKPPHFDEGINGWFVDQLIAMGFYHYDPTNYHGPFHFYVLLIFKILFGRNLWALRLPAVIFSFASLYLMSRFKIYIGKFAAYAGTFFAAISPGMIFYSRYAIHESELLFFSLLSLLGFLRFQYQKDKVALWQMGIGISGMVITKETFIIHMVCFAIAWACLYGLEKLSPSNEKNVKIDKNYSPFDLMAVLVTSILIIVCFYTGFFKNRQGLNDMVLSFMPWFNTAKKGNGHEKTFFYWVTLFARYEWTALLGMLGSIPVVFMRSRWARLLAIYALGILLAYSLIPYKTPWCVLNMIWPLLFVSGVLFATLSKRCKTALKWTMTAVFAFGIFDIQKSISLNFYHFEDEREPYVYVQTFNPILEINRKIQDVVKKDPAKRDWPIHLLMESSWPIPWLLGDFTRGNFAGRIIPPNPDGLVVFADAPIKNALEQKLKHSYFKQNFRLRSAQGETVVYFDADVFKDYFDKNAERFEPKQDEPLLPGQGLDATFYANELWVGDPVLKRHFPNIDFAWENSERPWAAPFGIIFSGQIFIPTAELILYSLTSDDGSLLLIDDKEIVNCLGTHSVQTVERSEPLPVGWHKFELKYNDYGGGMMARLMWKLPKGSMTTIPPKNFRSAQSGNPK